jgi:NAD(P)-dependent dehydrogenase (short-subunit alcohol dehydrogenase family)
VVFCAGVSIPQKIGSISKSEMMEMFEVNIISVIQITNALMDQIHKNQFFRLVFLSSIVGSSGSIGLGVYASTKSAIEGFAVCLNREFLKLKKINPHFNLACTVIRLGYTDTPMTSGLNPKIKAAIEERTTLTRFLKPNEVSYLISYLLRPESEGFTGSIIDFNGGVNL